MIATFHLSDHFADELVEAIFRHCPDPLKVAQMQVILPTKRACRSVKEAFVRRCAERPLLMPQLKALFEADDIIENVPPAIEPLERLFLLARLCQAKPNVDTPDQALKIATGLASLLDEFYLYEVSPTCLTDVVPEQNLAIHWQESLLFLDILRTTWPAVLAEKGVVDNARRRVMLIDALTQKIARNGLSHHLILAGFDGDMPAVQRLIAVLDRQEKGLVLLNGLDTTLEPDERRYITETHYQFALNRLLTHLKKDPQQILCLTQPVGAREQLIAQALKPAELTEDWRRAQVTEEALAGVTRIDCDSPVEEALAIACVMRTVLETPEKTAALVTNDRNLARRVISEMKRWGVELDDSAGVPLHHTPTGVFLSLIADYALNGCCGMAALALLKHPLCADGQHPNTLRGLVKTAEVTARREQKELAYAFQSDLTPFVSLFQKNEPVLFSELLTAHLQVAEALATSDDRSGVERLWETDDGEAAFSFFSELKEVADRLGTISPQMYPDTLTFLMSQIAVRPKYGMHPRLDILGPIEARLSHPDVCIIGGLNEGSFPQLPDSGPWLSRQMRRRIGLPLPERDLGIQAMDFAHCFCAKEVYLTRALKADGSQTIPSRFLSRLEAVLEGAGVDWLSQAPVFARLLDTPDDFQKIEAPAPVPPVDCRPQKLAVTGIERLMNNPYGVYARHILKLYPLDELEFFSEQRAIGTAIHDAFEGMLKSSDFDAASLYRRMRQKLEEARMPQAQLALWEPRLNRLAEFVTKMQQERQEWIARSESEFSGEITFSLSDGSSFTLTAKADRIDVMKDNALTIIDYKTGRQPVKPSDVRKGLKPQLVLEGLIARSGGFAGVAPENDIRLEYWQTNGLDDGGDVIALGISPQKKTRNQVSVSQLIMEAESGLKTLLDAYRDPQMPYEAYPYRNMPDFDEYNHLTRVKEWLSEEDDGE